MTSVAGDRGFTGSIPQIYETYLVPLIFEPYADDLSRRLAAAAPACVLEIAAGTGVVTRRLAAGLPPETRIVATDLQQPMLDQAAAIGASREVGWRQADAQALPFEDGGFDAVVCQFGVMFFPDKQKAFAEARRVLSPGGLLVFNVWDRIAENEFADAVSTALESYYPADPPRFLPRTPYGYHDPAVIRRDLGDGGFTGEVAIDVVTARSRAQTARAPAIAFCHGTPLRGEIEARSPAKLDQATDFAAAAIASRFGERDVDGKIQALVVTVRR